MGCGCSAGSGVSASIGVAVKSKVTPSVDCEDSSTHTPQDSQDDASTWAEKPSMESGASSCASSLPSACGLAKITSDTSRRRSFQGHLLEANTDEQDCEQIVVISDLGQDTDGEMALLLLGELQRRGEVNLAAVVANLYPADRRAAFARGTLDTLGMRDTPVGIGSDGGSDDHHRHSDGVGDSFSDFISKETTGVDYFNDAWESVVQLGKVMGTEEEAALAEKLRIHDGQKLLVRQLSRAEDKSLNLVLISSLKDAAMLLRSHEELFLAKIKCVTIMGGVQQAVEEPPPLPSESPPTAPPPIGRPFAPSTPSWDIPTPPTPPLDPTYLEHLKSLQGQPSALPCECPAHSSLSSGPPFSPSPKSDEAMTGPYPAAVPKVDSFSSEPSLDLPSQPESGRAGIPLWEASDAQNNMFDVEASRFVYRRCQEIGVPLIVVSRHASMKCPVRKYVYDMMVRVPVPHPIACRVRLAQKVSIEKAWQNVCRGDTLPSHCDKKWFCDTFCGGLGQDRSAMDSMWDIVVEFNMYDPLAVLAALPRFRDLFFDPVRHVGRDGTVHLRIGESGEHSGVTGERSGDLHDFLVTNWVLAAGRSRHSFVCAGEEVRPSQLDEENLTAALSPMRSHEPQQLEMLNNNVLRLLDDEWPKLKNTSLLDTWRDRDRLIRTIGPEMRLVDPRTIRDLGRIPHSIEGKAITMEEAANRAKNDNKRFFIEMFSHRWHSIFTPDDRCHRKARVLCEWDKYRDSMNFRTFFWIDFACINQSDIAPGVAMLPLYASCCNNILCYDTPSYEPRAWCRVERLLFAAFVAPNNEFINPRFKFKENAEKLENGDLKPAFDGKMCVPDPSAEDAQLSYPGDEALILTLKSLCTQHWGKCWKDGLMDIVEQKVGLDNIRNVRYGQTEVRMRKFG